MNYAIISFYQYIRLDNPEEIKNLIKEWCVALEIKGRILLAKEGINGAVSGKKERITTFKEKLRSLPFVQNLTFREQEYQQNAYHKLVVRVRKEIVVFGKEFSFDNRGKHLSPKELKHWYDLKEDFVVVDARNEYEFDVGKFKNAIKLPIKRFREFHQVAETLEPFKEKKIVLYCTGGIRCEKASAYLKEQGFKEVYQLEGGIINYVNQCSQDYFEGSCFVFDDRKVDKGKKVISYCSLCKKMSDEYINCYNLDCDTLFICCDDCQKKMNKTCSESCKNAPRQRQEEFAKDFEIIGTVENYFEKLKVALVKVGLGKIEKGMGIYFRGKTTPLFSQEAASLRDCEGNAIKEAGQSMMITLPVLNKVRRNDKVLQEV